MKTELGVGVAVLSALAAQGKDFDRTELNAIDFAICTYASKHDIISAKDKENVLLWLAENSRTIS